MRTGELRRLQLDLSQARKVQRRLLPNVPSNLERIAVAVAYHPAYEVGGDFYDWISTGNDRLRCVIGDVAGKGVAAALLMSWITAEFSNVARREATPAQVLEALNEKMMTMGQQDAFITALCVDIDLERQRATLANAGHVPAVRLRSATDLAEVAEASGAPLGVVTGEAYTNDSCDLHPGDVLLLATDGLTEALSGGPRLLGPRLRAIAAETAADPFGLAAGLAAAAVGEPPAERADDVTVVAIKPSGGV